MNNISGITYPQFDTNCFDNSKLVKMQTIIKNPVYSKNKTFAVGFYNANVSELCGDVVPGSDDDYYAEITFNSNVEVDKRIGEYAIGSINLNCGKQIEVYAKIIDLNI